MPELKTFSTSAVTETAVSRPCPLCSHGGHSGTWRTQGVAFIRCATCGLWRQDPQPLAEDILRRYGDEYLAYETERQLEYRAISLQSLAEAGLKPQNGQGKLMVEVGSATGALLAAFRDGGWETIGVETGSSMAAYARKRWALDVREGTLESLGLETGIADAFVATHLIEHLNEPLLFLREVRRVLKAGAALWLITPNADGFQALVRGAAWRSAIRDHLYLFSRRTLKALLSTQGFAVEYAGTWGGWPAGMRPRILKKPVDAVAKALGWGDVMVVRARKVGA